ncbi:hypothetical protein BGZ72_000950, partial [Mortierella alpina]
IFKPIYSPRWIPVPKSVPAYPVKIRIKIKIKDEVRHAISAPIQVKIPGPSSVYSAVIIHVGRWQEEVQIALSITAPLD